MKLAISGSAGTGKTTLARDIAESLNIEYIPEGFNELFELSRADMKQDPPEKVFQAYQKVLNKKKEEEGRHDSFISDRCGLDLFTLWLSYGMSSYHRKTREYYRACRESLLTYDYIIIPPWGQFPVKPLLTASGKQI